MRDETHFTCGACRAAESIEFETRFQCQSICRACWKAHRIRSLEATRDLLLAAKSLIRPAVDDSMPAEENCDQAEVRAMEALAESAMVCTEQLFRLRGKDAATEMLREAMQRLKGAPGLDRACYDYGCPCIEGVARHGKFNADRAAIIESLAVSASHIEASAKCIGYTKTRSEMMEKAGRWRVLAKRLEMKGGE